MQKTPIAVNVPVNGSTGTFTVAAAEVGFFHEIRGYKLTANGTGAVVFKIDATAFTADYVATGGGAVLPPADWRLRAGVANKAVTCEAGSVALYGNILILKWPA
jgi:hypothetical protein